MSEKNPKHFKKLKCGATLEYIPGGYTVARVVLKGGGGCICPNDEMTSGGTHSEADLFFEWRSVPQLIGFLRRLYKERKEQGLL